MSTCATAGLSPVIPQEDLQSVAAPIAQIKKVAEEKVLAQNGGGQSGSRRSSSAKSPSRSCSTGHHVKASFLGPLQTTPHTWHNELSDLNVIAIPRRGFRLGTAFGAT
jgi:hypothetical protein